MTLGDLKFSDLYLGEERSWLSGVPGTLDPSPAPADCSAELSALRQMCIEFSEKHAKNEFAVRHNGVAYRCAILKSISEDVFVLRRFPSEVPDIEKLGLHPYYVNLFMQPQLSGLIVVAGAYGQGKTTTASAIVAGRIKRLGGIAVCIEDPPEMPLEGQHGEGVIYQRWVNQGGFGQECRNVARWAPSIIFLGEVRDSETASEALRASINGRLAVCTIHSDNVQTAVDRLFCYANGVAGNGEEVSQLLASGLCAILHQKLEGEPRRLKTEFLWLRGEEVHGARSLIRSRKFSQLESEISLQRNLMFSQQRSRRTES